MITLVLLIILGLVVLGSIIGIVAASEGKAIAAGVGAVAAVIGFIIFFFGSTFTQDTGDASVLVDWTGNIVGQETAPGLHWKAPWVDVKTFSVRNQTVTFIGDGSQDHTGNTATGPQITTQDEDGVTSNIDVALRYSIRPDQVTNIYKQFRDEDTFKSSFIQQDVRSAIRSVPGQFHTLAMLTKRSEVEAAMRSSIEARWKGTAVSVDSLSLQEIRPPDSVKERYNEAQQAQIQVSTEQNKLNAAKVHAQQQVVQAESAAKARVAAAEGAAKANRILESSLTPKVLQQHALDTLEQVGRNGGTVIVGGGAQTLLQVGSK